MKIKILDNKHDFLMLKNSWNDLLKNSNADNIFLTWEWMHTWWEHFNKNKSLVIIIAEENDKLVGIAPLYLVKTIFFSLRPLVHLEFIGSVQTCPEYLDFIIQQGCEKRILTAILEKIFFSNDFAWDVFNMVAIKSDSENLEICTEYFRANKIKNYVYERRKLPYIKFLNSVNEFLKTLSKEKQKRFLRYKDNLTKDFLVNLEVIDNYGKLDNAYDTFLDIYRKRWATKGEAGSFSQGRNDYNDFHRDICKAFLNNSWLYFAVLKINKEISAIQYNFIYKNKLYNHSITFDPKWSQYYVGSVLMLMVVEDGIKKKLLEYDFLRGDEEYKLHWTKAARTTVDIVIWKSKITSRIVEIEKKFRKLAKVFIPKTLVSKMYKKIFTRQ